MQDFKSGRTQLLVATTVIEVGVDVPNASLMVIENAERLGLAQLHQLRGRVGRGAQESYCVLLYQEPRSQLARERLDILCNSNDGFAIAQKDLELRGPGELLGTRQTGLAELKVADLIRDADLLPQVRSTAEELLRENAACVAPLRLRWIGAAEEYGRIGCNEGFYGMPAAPLLRRLRTLRAAHPPESPHRHRPAALAHAVGAVDRRPFAARRAAGSITEAAADIHRRHRGDALCRLRHQRLRRPRHRSACEAHQRPAAGNTADLALRSAGAVRRAGGHRAVAGHAAGPHDRAVLVRRCCAHRELSLHEAVLSACRSSGSAPRSAGPCPWPLSPRWAKCRAPAG